MCGIAGVFGKGEAETVQKMLGRLTHRGPDDELVVSGARFTLGARRLSIIDVEGGRQPLSNETATVWVSQNGEIYNFQGLRSELEALGHRLRTRCDTEVIPHLYEEHGDSFPAKLRGMFAIALWDDRERMGVLARDHAGKKPIYYAEHEGSLYFASEIKALLALPGFDREPDFQAIHHFLSYKHVPAPLTAFRGIRALPPASLLTWRPGEGAREKRFWAPSWRPDEELLREPEEAVAERIRETLTACIRDRLVSDVPLGFYLSGGIDSSLSTAIAASLASGRIMTFTLAYDAEATTAGKERDRSFARAVSERYGTEHYEEVVGIEDFRASFHDIQRSFDQPFSGVTASYFLSRLIGRHVKVALSGDGADELFGSYLSHRLARPIAEFVEAGFEERDLPSDVAPLFEDHRDLVHRLASRDPAEWRARLFVFSEEEKRDLYAPELAEQSDRVSSEEHLREYFAGATALDPLNRILEAEFRGFLPDQVLAFVDRLSMAHSLETRTAYLDPRFISLAASIPGHLKIRGREVKYILKRAASRYLPEDLVMRPKEGFVMPVNQWLASSLGGLIDETLSPRRIELAGMLKADRVRELVNRFRSGESELAPSILTLLSLQAWWESYLGPEREL